MKGGETGLRVYQTYHLHARKRAHTHTTDAKTSLESFTGITTLLLALQPPCFLNNELTVLLCALTSVEQHQIAN